MSIQIIVDSSTDLRPDMAAKVIAVPLTVRFGDQEYLDGVTIDRARFYQMLVESDVMPSTSQPAPSAFSKVIRRVLDAGDQALIITLASKLSGTWQSAMIAAQDHIDRVKVIDSGSGAIGAGILVEEALQLRDSGLALETLAAELESRKKDICLIAMLDTLEYLKKGGRLSAAAAFAGGLLSIKPVAAVVDGEIKILGKARGSRQGNNLLVQEIEKAGGVDFDRPILLGWAGMQDNLLRKYIEDSRSLWGDSAEDLATTQMSSIIGTHTGPGTIAAAFFKKNKRQ